MSFSAAATDRGRLRRSGRAALLIVGVLLAADLALPAPTYACFCAPTEVAEFVGDPQYVILSGSIGGVRPGGELGTFRVERVYQGVVPAPQLPVIGGGGGDCTIPLEEGMQFIGVATVSEGSLHPWLCMPFGDVRDERGQAILADLRRLMPDVVPPEEPLSFERIATLALTAAGAIGLGLAALAGVVALSRRRSGT